MVKKLVTDKNPITKGYCDQSYRETDMGGESFHLCGGIFVFNYKNYLKI